MGTFEAAIQYVLDNEGENSNDAADSGGQTRFGITHTEAARHGRDIATLTIADAESIYRSDYWKFDGIVDQRVATKLFDMAVNLGLGTAVKIAQTAVRFTHPESVAADGIFGPLTEAAINGSNNMRPSTDSLLYALAAGCVRRYVTIVENDRLQLVFLRGWIERALKLPT
jgi:lysozyme family protein